MDKLRSRDDLKYSATDLYCTLRGPIKLPTLGHISQISLNIREPDEPWAFPKTYHVAAYKQLPMGPKHADLALAAPRHPPPDRERVVRFRLTALALLIRRGSNPL